MAKEFAPWNDEKIKAQVNIDIEGPPCTECKFWRPRLKTDEYGNLDGVILCHYKDQILHDFSCYKPKEEGIA